jgi:AcrR family transcriptional regulator
MARVTKDADVRRSELLDVAFELCVTEGFETASVERITNAAGVAKGTFYHYFGSKDELLTQMVTRFGDELFDHLETSMLSVRGDALERLRMLMLLSSEWKIARMETGLATIPVLFRPENFSFKHRLFAEWFERTRPLLFEIVEQGAREGTFDVADPVFTTDVLLTLWFDYASRLWERGLEAPDDEAFVDTMMRGADVIWTSQERILGVPEGSLHVVFDRSVLLATVSVLRESGVLRNSSTDQRESK